MNDYDVRGKDYDSTFATVKFYRDGISSHCLKAIERTTSHFHRSFPGWSLYRRLVTGDSLMDRELSAYAIVTARALARSKTKKGRDYIGAATRGQWISQAGLDGLHFAIFGSFPAGLHERAKEFDVSNKTYQKIRDPVGAGISTGVEAWRSELHAQFTKILMREKYPVAELDVEF
jgi:hypothetical protein